MLNYIFVSLLVGITFGFMDGIINGNSYAKKLFEVYSPIAKTSINIPLGIGIDLIYGFAMTGLFLLLHQSLPGQTGLVKGLSLGIIMWFFRVLMYVVSQMMMFNVPSNALLYILTTGFFEMLIIGMLIGVTLTVPSLK